VMVDPDDGMLVMVVHETSPFLDTAGGTLFARRGGDDRLPEGWSSAYIPTWVR
jgi:hypothetical protein